MTNLTNVATSPETVVTSATPEQAAVATSPETVVTSATPEQAAVATSPETVVTSATPEQAPAIIARLPQDMRKVTVGEYMEMVENDEVLDASFNRAYEWTGKQEEALEETLVGWGVVPALIVARMVGDNGEYKGLLRVDGNQRTGAIKRILARHDQIIDYYESLEDDAAKAKTQAVYDTAIKSRDYIKEDILWLHVIDCDYATAARLFPLFNNGKGLSSIQKNKALYAPDVQAAINTVSPMLKTFAPKWGKVSADTLASMLINAVISPLDKVTSASGPVSKVLKEVKALDIDAIVNATQYVVDFAKELKKADLAIDAVNATKAAEYAKMDKTYVPIAYNPSYSGSNTSYWTSAARIIPLVCAVYGTDWTPAEMCDLLIKSDVSSGKTVTLTKTSRGKNPVTTTTTTTVQAAFGDTGNGSPATIARVKSIKLFMAQAEKAASKAEEERAKAIAAAAAEAELRAAFEGGKTA